MKIVRSSIAILLLLSMVLTACSREEEVEAVVSETTEASEGYVAREFLLDQEVVTVPDYVEPTSYTPVDPYEFVLDSILDYVDSSTAESYIGMGDVSGIKQLVTSGNSKYDMAVAYVDVTGDGVNEMLILDLTDSVAYAILELYTYDEEYGIHSILHGNEHARYYLTQYMNIVCMNDETDCPYIANYWVDQDNYMFLMESYYTAMLDGVEFYYESWSEELIGSTDTSNDFVRCFGPVSDSEASEIVESYIIDLFSDLYSYPDYVRMSDIAV